MSDSHYGPNQPGQYSTPRPAAPPPKKRMPRWAKIVAVVCSIPVVIVGGCTAVVLGSSVASTVANQADKTPTISDWPTVSPPTGLTGSTSPTVDIPAPPDPPKPVEKAPSYLPEDGTLMVGNDVKAGTYQTRVPADGFGCYWARLRSLDGDNNIIDNNLYSRVGALVTLRVKAADVAVEINCSGATWKRIR